MFLSRSAKYLFVGLLASFVYPAYAVIPSAQIQSLLVTELTKYHIPGIVVSIYEPGQPIQTFTAGMSDVARQTPMHNDTLFAIGSVTKSFASIIILQLEQQGKLSLNDTLVQLARPGSELSATLAAYPYLKTITLQQILTHNSGLADVENADAFHVAYAQDPEKIWTDAQLMHIAMTQKPLFKPGTAGRYNYTNTDYLLAGMVIASVTGKSVNQNMDALFQQAGLQNIYYFSTGAAVPKNILNRMAQGYMPASSGWPDMSVYQKCSRVQLPGAVQTYAYNVTALMAYNISVGSPAGGIVATTATMADWYKALFVDKTLINTASLKQLTNGVPTGYGYLYGLGVTLHQVPAYQISTVSHNGSDLGHQTNLIYVQKYNTIIAIATNSDNDATGDFYHGIPNDLLGVLFGAPQ